MQCSRRTDDFTQETVFLSSKVDVGTQETDSFSSRNVEFGI
jgi:hypothetical protein